MYCRLLTGLKLDDALSLDAHVLPIIGPPLHDHEELETTPKDERGNHFWQVHTNALSVDVPVC